MLLLHSVSVFDNYNDCGNVLPTGLIVPYAHSPLTTELNNVVFWMDERHSLTLSLCLPLQGPQGFTGPPGEPGEAGSSVSISFRNIPENDSPPSQHHLSI